METDRTHSGDIVGQDRHQEGGRVVLTELRFNAFDKFKLQWISTVLSLSVLVTFNSLQGKLLHLINPIQTG